MLAFDIDGVIINSEQILQVELLKRYNIDTTKAKDFWVEIPNVSKEESQNIICNIIKENTHLAKPFVDNIKAVHKIYQIYKTPMLFITAREEDEYTALNQWFFNNVEFEFEIVCVGKMINKVAAFEEFGVTSFVDDHYEGAEEFAKYLTHSFLQTRPYNVNNKPILSTRIKGIDKLLPIVDSLF